jgi:hypothetical protein
MAVRPTVSLYQVMRGFKTHAGYLKERVRPRTGLVTTAEKRPSPGSQAGNALRVQTVTLVSEVLPHPTNAGS